MTGLASYDVVIVGGGIVGLTLANALKASGLRLAIIEQREPPVVTAEIDLRVSALNPASLAVFARSGVLPESMARICGFHQMHVWDSTGAGAIHFDAAELGLDTLGQYYREQCHRSGAAGGHTRSRYYRLAVSATDQRNCV